MVDTGVKYRVVLITGANHGIGAATALSLAAQGARIFIVYFGEPPADALVREIERITEVSALQSDSVGCVSTGAPLDRAEQTFGHVDILINNVAHCLGDAFISANDSRDWGGRRTVSSMRCHL